LLKWKIVTEYSWGRKDKGIGGMLGTLHELRSTSWQITKPYKKLVRILSKWSYF
jgi:hypothetical protein